MSDKKSEFKPEHLLWASGGALVGAWWVKNQADRLKMSRIETEDPELVEEVCEEIGQLLDAWEPDNESETEADFVRDCADYLAENTEYDIEIEPSTPNGQPDILIEGALALEFKVDPTKSERDRCVGQCAGYSRDSVTWIVLIDPSRSTVQGLERLLEDKGLERILVWDFS